MKKKKQSDNAEKENNLWDHYSFSSFSSIFRKTNIPYPHFLERLQSWDIGRAKTWAPSFKKLPDKLSMPAALDT